MQHISNKTSYDKIYSASKNYRKHYKESQYYPIWKRIITVLKKISNPCILEIGCGTGQLAHYLHNEGFRNYKGFDFSKEAIKIAREKSPQSFEVADVYNYSYSGYDVVIATEVLEHLENDIDVVSSLKKNTKFIFSLPKFICKGHVRWFGTEMDIKNRYKGIEIKHLIDFGVWFLCLGIIK